MLKRTKLLFLLIVSAATVWGTSFSFTGPSYAKPPSPALPAGQLIIGDPLEYQVFGAQLTQTDSLDWVLQIETNYPVTTITGNNIPPVVYGSPTTPFSIGDFLIMWNSVDYGIVLAPHVKLVSVDGYTAGNLYQTSGFQDSGSIMGRTTDTPPCTVTCSPNPDFPIWIDPSATQIGTGSVSIAKTGNGMSAAEYTITVPFSAPAGFLSTGNVGISFASYVCGNGVLTGQEAASGGGGGGIPEPATFLLIGPGLLLLGILRRR